jgi:hypothetical protein
MSRCIGREEEVELVMRKEEGQEDAAIWCRVSSKVVLESLLPIWHVVRLVSLSTPLSTDILPERWQSYTLPPATSQAKALPLARKLGQLGQLGQQGQQGQQGLRNTLAD